MYEQKTIYISINKLARCNKEVELVLLFLNIRRTELNVFKPVKV